MMEAMQEPRPIGTDDAKRPDTLQDMEVRHDTPETVDMARIEQVYKYASI